MPWIFYWENQTLLSTHHHNLWAASSLAYHPKFAKAIGKGQHEISFQNCVAGIFHIVTARSSANTCVLIKNIIYTQPDLSLFVLQKTFSQRSIP